ncbi:Phosphoribosylformylglycinamidine cyclo-ligase, chloroplastic [Capsicum annuum]|nr:Phosphoribosylformylglycinamidine cyclo-ligase, chloroplastic [Capsicum annuum]
MSQKVSKESPSSSKMIGEPLGTESKSNMNDASCNGIEKLEPSKRCSTGKKCHAVDMSEGDVLIQYASGKESSKRTVEVDMTNQGSDVTPCNRASKAKNWWDSYLVAGTDGVGTKLKLAFETGIHDTIGIDLVAMSVNDIVTSGAKPLFFLDYFATSLLDVDLAEKIAEMPDFYAEGECDLSGFAVGIVKKDSVIEGKSIKVGDVLIGLPSSGVHSNGFSLVRRVLKQSGLSLKDQLPGETITLGEALIAPTVIYVKQGSWAIPPVFKWIQEVRIFSHLHECSSTLLLHAILLRNQLTCKLFSVFVSVFNVCNMVMEMKARRIVLERD